MPTHLGNNNEYHQAPTCSSCGKKMTLRNSDYGDFWGCTGYPECRNRMPITGFGVYPVQLEFDLVPGEYTPEWEEKELRRIMREGTL
jgi:ssDNA-binding Zn-finger/Zn-ribbon topoisomerase 1